MAVRVIPRDWTFTSGEPMLSQGKHTPIYEAGGRRCVPPHSAMACFSAGRLVAFNLARKREGNF